MSKKTKMNKSTKKQRTLFATHNRAAVQNPSLTLGIAPPHPTPVPVYSDKWVKRIYSAALTVTTAIKEASFPASAFNVPGPFFVDKLQAWKVGNINTNIGLKATFKQGVFTDLGADDVIATDFGTADSLAGISCKVPVGHAISVATGANPLVVCAPVVPDPATTTSATFVVHLHCWIAV
jgi:hypothetical protein